MLEESDKSDSWGNLILEGIKNKYQESKTTLPNTHFLMNGIWDNIKTMSENMLSDDHEKRLVIGTKKPQKSQRETRNVVKRVTEEKTVPDYKDWCAKRQNQHYDQKKVITRPNDFTENKKVIKRVKSSEENSQNLTQTRENHSSDLLVKKTETKSSKEKNLSSDFLEKEIELDQVSLAPVKSSDLAPAQEGNEKGSEIAPAQTDLKQSDNTKEANSSEEIKQKIDQPRKNIASDLMENKIKTESKEAESSKAKDQKIAQPRKNIASDLMENKIKTESKEAESSKANDQKIAQSRKNQASDLMENNSEFENMNNKVGLDIKQDTHITMCAGKAGAIERVSFNHKLETVAKAVQTAIKDPLEVDHKGRPAMTADLNLNQPKINVEVAPIIDSNNEDSVEKLEEGNMIRYAHTGLLSTLIQSHNGHQNIESITTFDIMENSDTKLTHQISEISNYKLENLVDPIAAKFSNNSDPMINADTNLIVNINDQIDNGLQCIRSNRYDLNSDLQLYNSETCLSVYHYTCLCHYLEKQIQEHFESSRNSKNQNRK